MPAKIHEHTLVLLKKYAFSTLHKNDRKVICISFFFSQWKNQSIRQRRHWMDGVSNSSLSVSVGIVLIDWMLYVYIAYIPMHEISMVLTEFLG